MTALVTPTIQTLPGRSPSRAGWAIAVVLFALGLALLFRHIWWSGPARSINDNGDGTIVIALLEHWFRVFGGHAADWKAPEWFWPAPNTLSFTDTLFLLSLPYSAARLFGADWFTAINVVVVFLATVGYWGMVLLTRRGGVSPAIGGVFAFIFTFGTVPTFKLFHVQTSTIQLAPLIGLMLLSSWQESRNAALAWSTAAGLLIGLMFFTAAQTPWFLGIEIALTGLLAALFNLRHLVSAPRHLVIRALQVVISFGAGLAVGLVPFAVLYRHSLSLRREWDEVLQFSAYPLDVFNLPSGNFLWFDLLQQLGIAGQPHRADLEVALGWPPMLSLCAMFGFFLFGRIRQVGGTHPWDVTVRALLAAAALGPLISLHFRWFDFWYYVYRFVPGGHSIRTPFRIELAAAALLSLSLALVAARALQAAENLRRTGLAACLGAVLALLVVEQLGAGPITRDSTEMRSWMNVAHRPAFPCKVFYLIPSNNQIWQNYQSDAMLLSQLIEMPTINGNASFFPHGWNLGVQQMPEYARRALKWIDDHGLRDQVCGIEPRVGQWVQGVQSLVDSQATEHGGVSDQ